MIHKLNPVLIGGFDVLYIGKKGFSTLARAKKALLRAKGAKKDGPWIEISLVRYKTKKAKEEALNKIVKKLSKSKDEEVEEERRKKKKKVSGRVEKPDQIKFSVKKPIDKFITTRSGDNISIKKFYFDTRKSFEFVEGRELDLFVVQRYIQAAKREFLKILFSKYGKRAYLIRFNHEYKGLPSNSQNDPFNKKFFGFGINRQVMDRKTAIEQFDILAENYQDSFANYLKFGKSDTYFRFSGFSVEVTLRAHFEEKKKRKKRKKAR